jgi:hypothetical protein
MSHPKTTPHFQMISKHGTRDANCMKISPDIYTGIYNDSAPTPTVIQTEQYHRRGEILKSNMKTVF